MWKYNPTEIQHHGVPGMRWGRRKVRTTFKESAKAHEAKTAARDKGRQEKVSASISKFKESAKAHEAKTAARDKGRQEKVKNVINKIKNSAAMKKQLKDLYKEYGEIEDSATYGKGTEPKSVAAAQRRIDELDKKIGSLK